jgi:hypothetical protein
MSIVRSLSVGHGDMFYIKPNRNLPAAHVYIKDGQKDPNYAARS